MNRKFIKSPQKWWIGLNDYYLQIETSADWIHAFECRSLSNYKILGSRYSVFLVLLIKYLIDFNKNFSPYHSSQLSNCRYLTIDAVLTPISEIGSSDIPFLQHVCRKTSKSHHFFRAKPKSKNLTNSLDIFQE